MMKGQTQFDGFTGEVNAGPCPLYSSWTLSTKDFSMLPTVVYTANIHLHGKPTHASLITARRDKDKTLTALVTQETAVQAEKCSRGNKIQREFCLVSLTSQNRD